jgi:PEGA domain
LRRSGKLLVFFTLLFAAGCSSTQGESSNLGSLFPSAEDKPIRIDSDPSGAEVYVMGEKVGVTPLAIRRKDVFPVTYPKEKELLYGKVILKKQGCLDFPKTVNPKIIDAGLHAQLECGDMAPASPPAAREAPRLNATIEQRLEKIKELLNKGLITEEEAKKARASVLNDL